MKAFVKKAPENRPLIGMGTALVFFVSLLPIPAFTGTCSHPCGTPLIGILLGPVIGIALTGISLLLQAAFFAHGGFSTWGANVVALGFFGCGFGWGTFRLARRLGNLQPAGQTRMGAVLRHAIYKLDSVSAAIKLLVILTDGRPYDVEYGNLDYAVADTKKAIQEARRKKIHPFIITSDQKSGD